MFIAMAPRGTNQVWGSHCVRCWTDTSTQSPPQRAHLSGTGSQILMWISQKTKTTTKSKHLPLPTQIQPSKKCTEMPANNSDQEMWKLKKTQQLHKGAECVSLTHNGKQLLGPVIPLTSGRTTQLSKCSPRWRRGLQAGQTIYVPNSILLAE